MSVYGTGSIYLCLAGFLGSPLGAIIPLFVKKKDTIVPQLSVRTLLYTSTPNHFNHLFRQMAGLTHLRHRIAVYTGTGILTSFPSASPLGYTLGPD